MPEWIFRDYRLTRAEIPLLMGILNVTPDSFSDGGQHNDPARAVEHALKLVDGGADIIDVGGESTRPGSAAVDEEEELRRVVPVIRQLADQTRVPISIDTTKTAVAQAACDAGAVIVNDISGLNFDPEMPRVCAELSAGVVCMHILGTPRTMQNDPQYDDVVADVRSFLQNRVAALTDAGIAPEAICLDPGIGFGKTAAHNLRLLQSLEHLRFGPHPLLIGHSRKQFLSKLLGRQVEERLAGTIGVAIAVAEQGCDIVRVHDVQAVRDALLAHAAVANSVQSLAR